MTEKNHISIILPGWNEGCHIEACIASLRNQTYRRFNVLMILGSDNGLDDFDRARQVAWDRLIILKQAEPNKMKACNLALQHPQLGDILVFSDVDCEFPENFLENYAEAFKDSEKKIVTGRVQPIRRKMGVIDRYHLGFDDMFAPRQPKIIHSIVGANFAIQKKFFFEHIKQFDPTVILGTDHVIAQRLRQTGEPIHFDPRIIVYTHFFSAGWRNYIEQQTRWVKIRLLRNHGSNSKAFGRAVKSMGFAWLVTVILPATIVFSKDWLIRPAWWVIFLVWLIVVARAWFARWKIIRRPGKNDKTINRLLKDSAGALALVMIHYGTQILAGIQLFFGKRNSMI